jgi:hypothetical protein
LTSIDGKLAQIEAGPFFEFVKVAIEPLNQFLVSELHRIRSQPRGQLAMHWISAAAIYERLSAVE